MSNKGVKQVAHLLLERLKKLLRINCRHKSQARAQISAFSSAFQSDSIRCSRMRMAHLRR
jgi:hypothetical protein